MHLSARQHAHSNVFACILTAGVRNVRPGETVAATRGFGKTLNLPLMIPAGRGELFTLARILVVDDDAAVQMTVRLLLFQRGAENFLLWQEYWSWMTMRRSR
jgi:hypothetical protein